MRAPLLGGHLAVVIGVDLLQQLPRAIQCHLAILHAAGAGGTREGVELLDGELAVARLVKECKHIEDALFLVLRHVLALATQR